MRTRFITVAMALGFSACAVSSASRAERPAFKESELYSQEVMQRQFAQLAQMPGVDVAYTKVGTAREIKGKTGVKLPELKDRKVGDEAPEVITSLRDTLLAAGTETLIVFRNDQLVPAMRTITLKQSIRGIPVEGAVISLSIDPTTAEVTALFNYFVPDRDLPRKPVLTSAKAVVLAKEAAAQREDVEPASIEEGGEPDLRYYGGGAEPEQPSLVWAVNVGFVLKEEGNESSLVLVDAVTGAIRRFARTSYAALLSAYMYSANNAAPDSCRQNVRSLSRHHLRACNASGCSDWSPDEWLHYDGVSA